MSVFFLICLGLKFGTHQNEHGQRIFVNGKTISKWKDTQSTLIAAARDSYTLRSLSFSQHLRNGLLCPSRSKKKKNANEATWGWNDREKNMPTPQYLSICIHFDGSFAQQAHRHKIRPPNSDECCYCNGEKLRQSNLRAISLELVFDLVRLVDGAARVWQNWLHGDVL